MIQEFEHKFKLKSLQNIYRYQKESKIKIWFFGILIFISIFMFLPWTQNIKSKGQVTTRTQESRPQMLNSPISGKIEKWYVKEGDFVKKGDTILKLSEIKSEYLDPKLIERTNTQKQAKKDAIEFYKNKVSTAENQVLALREAQQLKTQQNQIKQEQTDNKLKGELAENQAIQNELELAKDQLNRQEKMFENGLVTKTQLQQRQQAYQNAVAKKSVIENKIAQTRQELIQLRIEKNSIQQDYTEKINKVEGDKFQNLSMISGGEGDIAKLENQVTNYVIRNGMYLLLAPQDGQIVQASRAGIGEIIKDGESVGQIIPTKRDYAVEIFVRPVDMPLISIGQTVRLTFDGFPAIIFSGWPNSSYGTFPGKIVAYENNVNSKGMFRIIIAEDSTEKKWPPQLKMGGGAQSIALLKNVPVWYELWRNINGFPPDFYTETTKDEKEKEKSKNE